MATITIPRVAAAGAVLGAIMLVQLARVPVSEPALSPFEALPLPAHETPSPAEPAAAAPPRESPAAAKQRELETMSETFRNTTFLIAIRDAGFVCNELLRVVGGFDDSTKWLGTCSEMLAYTLSVANDGTLRVAPMLQYMDHGDRMPIQDFNGGERVLPPQSVPQPVPR